MKLIREHECFVFRFFLICLPAFIFTCFVFISFSFAYSFAYFHENTIKNREVFPENDIKQEHKKNPGYRPPLVSKPTRQKPPKKIPEAAQEGPFRINLKADEIRYSGTVAEASGNVEAEYKGVTITADKIIYNQASREIEAYGSVKLKKGRDSLSGETLKFNMDTQKSIMTKAYGIAHDIVAEIGFVDKVFFWGEEVTWDEKIQIKKGVISSCNVPRPDYHYHISGEEITIIPGDRIRFKKARVFTKKWQWLGLNSLVLPLKSLGITPYFPHIGYNELEGFYVKESFIYFMRNGDRGSIFTHWFKNIGLGLGLEHLYQLKEKGKGKFKYYTIGSSRTGTDRYILSNRLYYRLSENDFISASYTSERFVFPRYSSPPIKNTEFYFGHKDDSSRYTFLLKDYIYGINRNQGFNFKHHYYFNEHLGTDIIVDYLLSETTGNRRYRLNTLARMVQKGDIFDTKLVFDHTDGNGNFYVNRLPEVALQSHPFKMGPFDSKLCVAVGSFTEMPSGVKSLRSDMKFSILNKVFSLGSSGDFALAGGARQFIYNSGDRKYLIRTRAALEERLGKYLSFVVSHNFQDNQGFSPLAMDYYENYHILGTTLQIHDRDKLRIQLNAGYDINNKIYQSIIPRLEYCPSRRFKILVGSTYDYNNRLWMNVDGELGVRVSSNVALKYWALYDLINRRMTYQNYVVEVDSHDFLTRFIYKGSQGELWLDFNLKLVPFDPAEVGPHPNLPVLDKKLYDGAPDEESVEE